MILSRDQVRSLYRRTARFYDLVVWAYRLLGADRHRRTAVEALRLRPGETVVDMGCGTGLNFPYLQDAVGPTGRIVGVDLTDAMLERAGERAERHGWQNIELVEADLLDYVFPPDVDAALATFALEMVPEYDAVIRRVADALPPGKRLALLGLKHPERWPEWLVRLGVWLNKPFGVSREYASFRPWLSLRRYLNEIEHVELYWGAAYFAIGEVAPELSNPTKTVGNEIPQQDLLDSLPFVRVSAGTRASHAACGATTSFHFQPLSSTSPCSSRR